ncbi:MAG: three-Cys-motif partner protein TcmP [Trichodesmium sp.]
MAKQVFGGNWTEDKLNRVRKYLGAYAKIMNKYSFNYAYIDAFAGTGYREIKEIEDKDTLLFPEFSDLAVQRFLDGSARIALQVTPRFNKYIFIEKNESKVSELNQLKRDFPQLADDIVIVNEEANKFLKNICLKDWTRHRAVLFLDPFGMDVKWNTVELIAQTKAIDLWYLFPIMGVNRLLKKDGNIEEVNRSKLNEIFGTIDWYDTFYQVRGEQNLFGFYSFTEKTVDGKSIGQYFIDRLKTIFEGVAENPLLLYNSCNSPLFLLCFAAANKKGAKTAIKIAQDILRK